jgi:hypothetical protein
VPVAALPASTVSFQDRFQYASGVTLHPEEQCGSHVETDPFIVVDHTMDPAGPVHDPRVGVRGITFGTDALVPIVVRVCGVLHLDRIEPRIFSRRLIEMTVYAEEPLRVVHELRRGSFCFVHVPLPFSTLGFSGSNEDFP